MLGFLRISYIGTNYSGSVPSGNRNSIVEAVEAAGSRFSLRVRAVSRTDAGVHAEGQVLKVTHCSVRIDRTLISSLNFFLPQDIRVLDCRECSSFLAANRVYRYSISKSRYVSPTEPTRVFLGKFSVKRFFRILQRISGTHDFAAYRKYTKVEDTVRKIEVSCKCTHTRLDAFFTGKFMNRQIRKIVWQALQYAKYKISLEKVLQSLSGPQTHRVEGSASPRGLTLVCIKEV